MTDIPPLRGTLRRAAVTGGVLVTAGLLTLPLTASVSAAGPCVMTVVTKRVAHHALASGVVMDRYAVTVTRGRHDQTATVERLLMPKGSAPSLVTQPLGHLRTLAEQIRSRGAHTVAAVNGDFFHLFATGRGRDVVLPVGASVSRGRVVRSASDPTSVVGVDTAGHPYAGTLATAGTVTYGTASYPVTGVNWHRLGSSSVLVLTPRWAGTGDAQRPAGVVEWVVARGRLTDVRTGDRRGLPVARGTRVVAFGSIPSATARNAVVGERVTVAVAQTTSTGVSLREAIGRRRTLVEGGTAVLSCNPVTVEPRPRTTVGWTTGGRWATLTVLGTGYDAQGYRFGGLGLAHEANLAAALGFRSAYELDGGGSTAAYVHRADSRWDRIDDTDTRWAREIPNGLVFTTR